MEKIIRELLVSLGENPERKGLKATPRRVAESMKYLTSGYSQDLKKIIKKNIIDLVDHSLILNKDYPVEDVQKIKDVFCNIVWVDYQPTSENLLHDFANRIIPLLPDGVNLFSLRLRETANSYAEWFADDNT